MEQESSFQVNILKKINKENADKNFLISPLSMDLIISLVANGAVGETQNEILKALCYPSMEVLNKRATQAMKEIKASSSVEVANAVLTKVKPTDDFTNSCKQYEALIDKLSSADQVNKWVSEKTKGKITNIIDSVNNLDMILLNAIYFLGKWHKEFDEKKTADKTFTTSKNEKKTVKMMSTHIKEGLYYQDDKCETVTLQYEQDDLEGVIVLPKPGVKIDDFIEQLGGKYFKDIVLGQQEYEVNLELPRFKVESEISLNESLKAIGMENAFGDKADFSKLTTETKLKISQAKQKTFIDVNEKGTEAAGATMIGMTRMMARRPPPKIANVVCDRPFLFIVNHRSIENRYLFVTKIAEL